MSVSQYLQVLQHFRTIEAYKSYKASHMHYGKINNYKYIKKHRKNEIARQGTQIPLPM